MILPIDETKRIVGTKWCWELQRYRKDEERWAARSYFTTLSRAVHSVAHEEIRLHPAVGVAEAIEAVSTIIQRFEELIPESLFSDG